MVRIGIFTTVLEMRRFRSTDKRLFNKFEKFSIFNCDKSNDHIIQSEGDEISHKVISTNTTPMAKICAEHGCLNVERKIAGIYC